MTKGDLFYQCMFGWSDGAGSGAMDPKRADHADDEMRYAYNSGYAAGQGARRRAAEIASERYGYRPGTITTQPKEGQ